MRQLIMIIIIFYDGHIPVGLIYTKIDFMGETSLDISNQPEYLYMQ